MGVRDDDAQWRESVVALVINSRRRAIGNMEIRSFFLRKLDDQFAGNSSGPRWWRRSKEKSLRFPSLRSQLKQGPMSEDPNMEDSFVQLITEHQPQLRAFVLSMMPGNADVDDVIQEANKVIWNKRGSFKVGTSFKAWMFSVAKFEVLSAWRDRKRRKEWTVPESVLLKLLEEGVESATEPSRERIEVLRECLAQLPSNDRALIVRRYFDRRKVKDVAAEAGKGADSVKMSLYRIRLALGSCVRRKLQVGGEPA